MRGIGLALYYITFYIIRNKNIIYCVLEACYSFIKNGERGVMPKYVRPQD